MVIKIIKTEMADIREISHFPDDVIIHDVTFFWTYISLVIPTRKMANKVVNLHLFKINREIAFIIISTTTYDNIFV